MLMPYSVTQLHWICLHNTNNFYALQPLQCQTQQNYAKKIQSQKYKNCRSFSCQQNFTSFPGANPVLMAVGFYRLLSHHILLNKDIDNVCLQTASVIFPQLELKLHKSEKKLHTHTHTHTRLTSLFSGTIEVSQYQKGKTNLDFTEAREWVAVASAGPYASLLLAPERQLHQHPTALFFTGRMSYLPPNQQRQSTEGTIDPKQRLIENITGMEIKLKQK